MLTPEEFGSYYAVGAQFNAQGEAIFFEIDPHFRSDDFPFDQADERCVPDANGRPKETVYLSIYRVLERIPVSALGSLFLATDDDRTLELKRCEYEPETERALRLYQELCPVTPMVASRLEPMEFCRSMTNPDSPVHVPRIAFSELILQGLRTDPESGATDDLPYYSLDHLRDVLKELQVEDKASKMVLRHAKGGIFYRTVRSGFFVGGPHDFAFYRFPTIDELERDHHAWWRSAQTVSQL